MFIDLIGYRKMGHNELDQPAFTQPLQYKIIAQKEPVCKMYRKQLLSEGFTEDELKVIEAKALAENEEAYAMSKVNRFKVEEWSSEEWERVEDPNRYGKIDHTGVDISKLTKIGEAMSYLPTDKKFHPQLLKIF